MTRRRNGRRFRWFTTVLTRERADAIVVNLRRNDKRAFHEECGDGMYHIFVGEMR